MPATVQVPFFSDIIQAKFYPDGSFLKELFNMDAFSNYNSLNLAEVGADPNVVENNSNWPLTPVQRSDKGIQIPLATFDTTPTHITKVDELETNYDKTASVLAQHVSTLLTKCSKSAAYNLSPSENTSATPVLKTTGTDRGDGKKALTFKDVTNLSLAFDVADIPAEGRVLVLCPQHKADLKNEDMKQYKAMMTDGVLDGFKVFTFTGNPTYDVSTGKKKAYGVSDGNESSFAFSAESTLRCMGDVNAQAEERWADYRGWLIGAQIRFVAMPRRSNGYGAIYSDKAA